MGTYVHGPSRMDNKRQKELRKAGKRGKFESVLLGSQLARFCFSPGHLLWPARHRGQT